MLNEFIPIILFFMLFKLYGIYVATAALMIMISGQGYIEWKQHGKLAAKTKLLVASVIVLGGATLAFHDQRFIMWKPTLIFTVLSLTLLMNHYNKKKLIIQNLLEENILLPIDAWKKLNIAWSLFFLSMAVINCYVILHYTVDQWVSFKLFGIMGLTLLFTLAQAIYIAKHQRKVT